MSFREAEKKFWRTPELLESLLPFLDPASILTLAKVHSLTTGVMQGGLNWTRFLKSSCPSQAAIQLQPQNLIQANTTAVTAAFNTLKPIVQILKLMGKLESQLLQLLDIICKRFPPINAPHDLIKIACPCSEVHEVSYLGLCLLEQIERSTRTSKQQVSLVVRADIRGSILHLLKSRVTRPGGKIGQIVAGDFVFDTQDDAEAFLTLVKHVDNISFRRMIVRDLISEEGWAALAEALRLLPPLVLHAQEVGDSGFWSFVISSRRISPRNLMLQGRRQDLRALFNALPVGSTWHLIHGPANHVLFHKEAEEDWTRLEQYLDTEEGVDAPNGEHDH